MKDIQLLKSDFPARTCNITRAGGGPVRFTGIDLDVGDLVSLQLGKRSKPKLYRIGPITEFDANGRIRTRTKRRKPKK